MTRYAIACVVIAGISYLLAGILATLELPGLITLPMGIVLMIAFLFGVKNKRRQIA